MTKKISKSFVYENLLFFVFTSKYFAKYNCVIICKFVSKFAQLSNSKDYPVIGIVMSINIIIRY